MLSPSTLEYFWGYCTSQSVLWKMGWRTSSHKTCINMIRQIFWNIPPFSKRSLLLGDLQIPYKGYSLLSSKDSLIRFHLFSFKFTFPGGSESVPYCSENYIYSIPKRVE
jgi:hypothetical protein